jgi:hypothetical protein
MPKGPRGEKRPADVIGTAITVAKIATGEIKEELGSPDHERNTRRDQVSEGQGERRPSKTAARGSPRVAGKTAPR